MSIKSITTDFAGEVGVQPRLVRIRTTDSLATITTAGYLNATEAMGFTYYPNDIFAIAYGTDAATSQFFTQTITDGVSTLEPSTSDVVLPVVDGNFAVFSGTSGALDDRGFLPSDAGKTVVVMLNGQSVTDNIAVFSDANGTIKNGSTSATYPGNLHAGLSGTEGHLVSYPPTASSGTFSLQAINNAANVGVKISNSSHGQATTYSINDVGQSTGWLMNCTHSTDAGANLISFDITAGQAALASAGSVTLQASSGSKQYKIRALQINSGGTNFSGGGGNRLGQVTDGTTVYSVIPAASMQTLANAQWGVAPLPNPASAAINTSTAAGASLVFKYSGGTTDYTAGSIVISGILERVA